MRFSAVLGCLLSVIVADVTVAQCPTYYQPCTPVRAQGCSSITARPACSPTAMPVQAYQTVNSCGNCSVTQQYPIVQSCSVVQGYSVVQSYPAQNVTVQGYPTQGYATPSYDSQSQPLVASSTVPQVSTVPGSITDSSPQAMSAHPPLANPQPQVAKSNCNCNGSVRIPFAAPQPNAEATSILENKRSPFSLAGHARQGRPILFCMEEFLVCCGNGGTDCMLNYIKCSEITGEPLRYNICPQLLPKGED